MKLLLLLLMVLAVGVEAQQRRPYCTSNRDCRKGEVCRSLSRSQYRYWFWFRPGVCRPRKPLVKTCSTGSDCSINECCESTAQLRGRKRRQAAINGVCKPLQASGGSCLIQYPSGKPAFTVLQCPCTAQLTCIPDGGRLVPQGETGVCGIPEPGPKRCTSGSDCARDECCESTAQVKGRKKRQIGGSEGICKPLQKSKGSCLIQYPSGKPASTVLQCPCTAQLTCIPDGGRLVPQGETGVCGIPEPEPKRCTSGSDCARDECCESTAQVKGRKKRQIGGSEGICKPLQKSKGSCLTQYGPGKPSSTVFRCPCESGLRCEADGGNTPPLGDTGICRAPVSCETGADCGAGECCKSRVRPIGRRRRRQLTGGVCEPLSTTGDSCLTRYGPGKPDSMVYSCPCQLGLTCKGSGIFDIPLGETGTCSGED